MVVTESFLMLNFTNKMREEIVPPGNYVETEAVNACGKKSDVRSMATQISLFHFQESKNKMFLICEISRYFSTQISIINNTDI